MKLLIKIVIVGVLVISLFAIIILKTRDNKVVFQIIETDVVTKNKRVYESMSIKEEEIIVLKNKQLYECNRKPNDIKVIKITDDYVKISRNKLSYDQSNKANTEEVVTNIRYGEPFSVSIDDYNPVAGACQQPKYQYELQFIKQ